MAVCRCEGKSSDSACIENLHRITLLSQSSSTARLTPAGREHFRITLTCPIAPRASAFSSLAARRFLPRAREGQPRHKSTPPTNSPPPPRALRVAASCPDPAKDSRNIFASLVGRGFLPRAREEQPKHIRQPCGSRVHPRHKKTPLTNSPRRPARRVSFPRRSTLPC
jgi:hypothetical protein